MNDGMYEKNEDVSKERDQMPGRSKIWGQNAPFVQGGEKNSRKLNFFHSCFFFGCGGCLGCILLIILFCVGIYAVVSMIGDDSKGSNVTVKTVHGFDRKSEKYIAVIPIHGVIMPGKSSKGIITPDEFSAMLEKAEKDPNVKGVIISIDSPGGEVNAADEIYRKIVAFRKKTKLPVVALMRTIATSGGYYVAAGCDKIVAGDTTMTGSIGVIISSYNVKGLLDKIGVQGEVYKSGEMKDMLSPTKDRTPEERQIVQGLVQDCYIKFATIVSNSRKIPLDRVMKGPIGDGRIYHGSTALKYGMIDKVGHMEDAVILCETMSGSGKDTLTVKQYSKPSGFIDTLLEGSGFLRNGVDVNFNLPGKTPGVELQPGRIYLLPAGL